MPALRVALCTNRPPAAVRPALDALAEAGEVAVLLVANVPDPAPYRELAHPALEVLHEPLPGLSRARNRALAECAADEVLCFVDDDALVAPDWLTEMRAAWERASERVACIGGPIRPRFAEPRPEWLSDQLLPVLTVLDYGPEPLDLDPAITTVYGANLSFRAGPLRAVGGFDPRLGHGGRPTGFGEDDEAERALHRAGWIVRYEPGPWVWHVIPPARTHAGDFLRRRMHYGVGLGARRTRPRALALRQAASSAAGAPLALLRGDERLAMERATRAAENAGVLLAPVLGRSRP